MGNEESTKLYTLILDRINDAERMLLGEHTSERMEGYYQGKIHALREISVALKGL